MTDANSRKEKAEGLNYVSQDVALDLLQHGDDEITLDFGWASFAELYAEGGGTLHIHFRVASAEGRVTRNHCATFNRIPEDLNVLAAGVSREIGAKEGDLFENAQSYMRKPVLVSVVEGAEYPQELAVPSIVRLQSLDSCLYSWVDAPGYVLDFVQDLIAFFGKDGERGVPRNATGQPFTPPGDGVVEGEFVGKVVESRPKVMEEVTDNEPPFVGRVPEIFGPDDVLAALEVRLGPNSVRAFFDPETDFGFQALQVLKRPL